ncbi:MAG TPA: transporter [Clostridiales bacterium]|nr:transporter [Clostridiales bacterium]HCU55706.1 transporter [Clostridiales bacterium]
MIAAKGSAGEIVLALVLLFIGIALIVKGGDFFVDAASWIAEVSGLPPLLIGATIVSVATTLPELIVSIIATAGGSVDIAVGNAVGSVVANLGLIMAISLLFMPSKVNRKDYLFKSAVLVFSVINLLLIGFFGGMKDGNHILNVGLGILVLELFFLFLGENVYSALKLGKKPMANGLTEDSNGANTDMAPSEEVPATEAEETPVKKDKKTILINILKFIGGAGGIVGGAFLLVNNGEKLAKVAGVPEGIIAITLVAIGTSLPELVTTISAIVKKKSSISVGNIIGANILDMTLILPVCAMVSGGALIMPRQSVLLDLPFCLGLSLIAVVPMLITKRFRRWQGVALAVAYAAYITLRVLFT